jgi:hypothetical protein
MACTRSTLCQHCISNCDYTAHALRCRYLWGKHAVSMLTLLFKVLKLLNYLLPVHVAVCFDQRFDQAESQPVNRRHTACAGQALIPPSPTTIDSQ